MRRITSKMESAITVVGTRTLIVVELSSVDQSDASVGYFGQSDARIGYFDQSDARISYFDQSDARFGYFGQSDASVGYFDQSDASLGFFDQSQARSSIPVHTCNYSLNNLYFDLFSDVCVPG